MILTLDLACPIAWRTAVGSVEPGLSAAFSPTTPTLMGGRSRTAQKDYFGEEVVSSIVASSSKKLVRGDDDLKIEEVNNDGAKKAEAEAVGEGDEGVTWLARRYHETLWLGEEHSPLIGFLHHLSRFERGKKTRRGEGIAESSVAVQARSLLRTRRQIRKRYASATEAAGGGGGGVEAGLLEPFTSKRDSFVQELARESDAQVDVRAEEMIKMAIDSGPGRLVGDELSRATKGGDSEKQGMGRMTKVWLQAIECRELQIQILLVLYLLQLSTRLPPPSFMSSSSSTTILPAKATTITPTADPLDQQRSPLQSVEPNAPLSATTPPASSSSATTKRKRKADHARRWTGVGGKGMMAAFPWTLQRQTSRDGGQQREGMDKEKREEDDCTSAESLSKRFESLLDSLSLQVLTCSVGLDAKSILSSPSSSHTIRVRERLQPWQLFGSEGRRRQRSKEDKKDVLQWLCCSVIEPYFSKTLPRQCGIVRGKCFVPGSGTTPAKPARKELLKVRGGERDRDRDRDRRRRERQEEDGGERARRSVSRGKSPSPAPTPWSLLRNQAADESKQPVSRSSAFLEKLDARTVNVRKKWVRSQSIGPLPSALNGSQADRQQQQQQAPSRSLSSISSRGNSVQPDSRSAFPRQSRPSLEPKAVRRESQTLVMATPSKSQAYSHLPRSSSFSTSNASHLSSSTSTSAVPNINSWRRTESQPVLTNAVGQRGSRIHNNDDDDDDAWMQGAGDQEEVDDIAADEQIVDSLFFDESDDEEEKEGSGLPLVASPIQTKRAILDAAYNDHDDDNIRNDDDDFDGEIVVAAKKRRILPNTFSFAFLGGESTTLPLTTLPLTTATTASQTQSHARNPFAVSQS